MLNIYMSVGVWLYADLKLWSQSVCVCVCLCVTLYQKVADREMKSGHETKMAVILW